MTEKKGSLFEGACPEWLKELDTFTDTGMASEAFLAHLDVCPACQAVTDKIMRVEAEALEEFARELRRAGGDHGRRKSRVWSVIDRIFKVFLGCCFVAFFLLTAMMVSWGYAEKRERQTSREVKEKLEVLFPGSLERYCSADPDTLCFMGRDEESCAVADHYYWLPFPAPNKVLCRFDSWPRPHPAYGAAFVIVEGPEVVGYIQGPEDGRSAPGPRIGVACWPLAISH